MILTKCIVVGESGVGKSSVSNFYTSGVLADGVHNPTIGIEFYSKLVKMNGKNLKLQIWDTAGQERFASIVVPYFRDACGVLICFSIIKRETFDKLGKHIDGVKRHCPKHTCMILVGTYSDMQSKREVSHEEAERLAKELGIPYFELSAMTGSGINHCFDKLLNDICHAYDEGLLEYETLMDVFELEPASPKKSCCGIV
jgi:small GTP-binding protein